MKRKSDKVFLIISIIIGVVLGITEELVYTNSIIHFKSRILCITVYLFAFALILGLILLFKGLRNSSYVNFGKVMLLTMIAAVVFTGCSALFEYLYEVGGDKPRKFKQSESQYAFLIDDSGSMELNDVRNERYDAVESIIRNMTPTKNFSVYRFADMVVCDTPMESSQSDTYQMSNSLSSVGGGTNLLTAINQVIADITESGKKHTKIIILTDGAPTDFEFSLYNSTIKNAIQNNTAISSVGFGDPYEDFLTDLATNTGGMYVFSDNISSLTANLETVVNAQTLPVGKNRDLLGYRLDLTSDSFLYGFLRVLFLVLLGVLWSVIKLLLIGEKKFTQYSAVLSVVLCSVAAVLCEIMLLFGINSNIVRIIFCAMWACTLIPKNLYEKTNLENSLLSGQRDSSSADLMNDFDNKSQEVGGPKSFL